MSTSMRSVNTYSYSSRSAASALRIQSLENGKLKEAHGGISALSLMERRFSFLTETGKNINTGGGGGQPQGSKGPGARPRLGSSNSRTYSWKKQLLLSLHKKKTVLKRLLCIQS